MELLTDIWDKTTDAMTAVTEGVSDGLIRLFGNSNERQLRRIRPIVAKINDAFVKAINDPSVKQKLIDSGAVPVADKPEAFGATLKAEFERLGKVVREKGIKETN